MENSSSPSPNQEILRLIREKDASPAAAAFSSVTGVLGGFSITIVVLALTPGTIAINSSKNWSVSLVLLSAGLYIYSSGIFANSISFEDKKIKYRVFTSALLLFHLSNLLLSIGILLITFQFPLFVARLVATLIAFCAFIVATRNFSSKTLASIAGKALASIFTSISSQ
jgi:hypothetical protein